MTPKFYAALWILLGATALGFLAVGAMNLLAGVTFGFIVFGLIWAGMICVLPGQFGHNVKHHEPIAEMPKRANVTAVDFTPAPVIQYKRAA